MIIGPVAAVIPYAVRKPLYEEMLRKSMVANSEYMESFGITMTPEMIEAGLPRAVVTGIVGMPFGAAFNLALMALLFYVILKIMGEKASSKHTCLSWHMRVSYLSSTICC